VGKQIKDKVVLLTGASSGIGRATALLLAGQGARLSLVARRNEKLKEVADEIEAKGGQALAIKADVTKSDEVKKAVDETLREFKGIDILINNAGGGAAIPVQELTEAEVRGLWELNFMGTFYFIKALLPYFLEKKSGHIINVATSAALRPLPLYGAYCASKAAVIAFSESLRSELIGTGVKLTIVYPFITQSEFYDVVKNKSRGRGDVIGPVQTAETVARVILRSVRRQPPQAFTLPGIKLAAAVNHFIPGILDRFAKRVAIPKAKKVK
jgi:short-subunit dehydrogenase